MTIRRFIGDVHGKYAPYKKILKESPYPTIQVGDLGVGFRRTQGPKFGHYFANPPHKQMVAGGHRFIRGNHDNPAPCKRHSQWIADGTVEGTAMFIGGAVSIDRAWRMEDFSWWPDEELSHKELDDFVQKYIEVKPETMVTHDAPQEIAEILFARNVISGLKKDDFPSRTRQAFQAMLSAHSPKLWIFGHHHISFDYESKLHYGTRFVCLAELEYKDFDI